MPFLFHLLVLITINYFAALAISKRPRKWILYSVVLLDLVNLGVFKYFYFFTDMAHDLTGLSLFDASTYSFKILLPLAISFYTFQIIAFVVDVHRGVVREMPSAKRFFLFILFFPQLIAGPIMRTTDFLPQMDRVRIKPSYVYRGLYFIMVGVAKKILVADNIATLIDPVWSHPEDYSALSLVLATHAFAWQVYGDFAGYTDIARGSAFLMGFNIPDNFRAPFLSKSFRELWRRWHITLMSWLRDYIYFPLGGSRVSTFRANLNVFITTTVGGFWHGADWTYVFWGAYLGLVMIVERIFQLLRIRIIPESKAGNLLRILVTYHLFLISIFFFRAVDLSDSIYVMSKIFTWDMAGGMVSDPSGLVKFMVGGLLLQLLEYPDTFSRWVIRRKRILLVVSYALFFILMGAYAGNSDKFIYFNF